MSIRDIGLSLSVLALAVGCGGEPEAKSPDGSVGGPVTDVQRLYPLEHNTVFSYVTTDETGDTGIYIIEVGRPRQTMAELKVAGNVMRRYISGDGVQAPGGGYVLRAPLSKDAEWRGEFGEVSVKSTSRSIKVPAGEFGNCLETLEKLDSPSVTKTATSVFCPGIGMVYYLLEGEQGGVKVAKKLELKSFGPRFVAGAQ
ncbi:MAG: hypothetical protein EOO73_25680 [Myxococcales bacterium]|nr:MAG: hypothetical protein EOO73_25680 [Myxococcales bacterium]